MEAASQAAVLDHLRGQGYLPIRADEAGGRSLGRSAEARGRPRAAGSPAQDVTGIIRELSSLLRAGLALDQALAVLINFTEKEPVKKLMGRVLERVRGGASLADAMAAQGARLRPLRHRHGPRRRGRRRARQRAGEDRRVHGQVAPVEAEPEVGADLPGGPVHLGLHLGRHHRHRRHSRASRRSSTRPASRCRWRPRSSWRIGDAAVGVLVAAAGASACWRRW